MSRSELFAWLQSALVSVDQTLGVDGIKEEHSLVNDLGIDSLRLEQFLTVLRDELPEADFSPWYMRAARDGQDTVASIVDFVQSLQPAPFDPEVPAAASQAVLPTILSVRSAILPFRLTQEEFYQGLARSWYQTLPDAEQLMATTKVRARQMFWDPRLELALPRSTGERMRAFKANVTQVVSRCVADVLAGYDQTRVGSFVTTTNTGYFAPMLDYEVMRALGLRTAMRRTVIGSMGCFSAFNAIKVAMDSLVVRPDEMVMVNCTEASSLHYHSESTKEQAVVNLLFGDACVSMLMGARQQGAGPQFLRTHTEHLFDAAELMTGELTDAGFRMTLSPYVPYVLAEHVEQFVDQLLEPLQLSAERIQHWGIHPGGPKIVDLLAERLRLHPRQTRASRFVLQEFGNCGAATSLLVLEDILLKDKPSAGEFGVLMSFGPGLTMEGAVVRF